MKSELVVSFFTRPAVAAHIIRCAFPATSPMALQQKIAENMRVHKHFSCYRDASGAVVALDKFGICVTV